jgi:hypothetical protein
MIENWFDAKIKGVYFNNGGEFIVLWSFFVDHSISHYTTTPYIPLTKYNV